MAEYTISKIKLPNGDICNIKDTTYSAGTGIGISGTTVSNTGVTGIKGNSESSYRTGQVNLTPANIGAVGLTGNDTISGIKTFNNNITFSAPSAAGEQKGFVFNGVTDSAGLYYLEPNLNDDGRMRFVISDNDSDPIEMAWSLYRSADKKIPGQHVVHTFNARGYTLSPIEEADGTKNPIEIKPSIDNFGSIGNSSYKWANIYATNFHGNLTGNVTGNLTGTASKATADADGNTISSTYLKLSGGTLTGALNTANGTWNTIGDDAYFGDINKAGHIGIKGKNGNTGLLFVTYNQSSNTTGGAITWDGTKFSITSNTAIDASISGSAGSVALSGVTGADDLKAIEALSGTSGFLKKTTTNTWTLDTNTYLTSSTGVTSIAGKTGAVTLADLGLSNAMHFLGVTTTNVSTGTANTTATVVIGGSNVTAAAGDVVLYGSQEYVWGNSKWNLLGDESSYKVKQTAKTDPTASTATSTTFIDTISQDANGVITATKKTLPSYVPTSAGVTAVTWDSTNKKLTRTINGTAADVVTIDTIKTALALTKSDVGLGNVANSTYAGGTAVTLNNSSKASSTASFYAPTTGGTANTQALVGNGATSAPKWADISPSITIGAGTGSAAPTVNVTVLGQSGTAKSITTASTSVYGVTKLNDGITSNSTTLAATANSALIAAKKVASSNNTSKLYLVGATSQSAAGIDSYSFQYTYTNNGLLSALKLGLNLNGTEKAHLEWNDTDQSIDFIFN